jgi:hypothetical protein
LPDRFEHQPRYDDLVIVARPDSPTRKHRYWIEIMGGMVQPEPFRTRDEALATGRDRAAAQGVSLWEETADAEPDAPVRLVVSFRTGSRG